VKFKAVISRILIMEASSLLGAIACAFISLHVDCWNVISFEDALEDCLQRGSPSGLIGAAYLGAFLALGIPAGLFLPTVQTGLAMAQTARTPRNRARRLLGCFGLALLSVATLVVWAVLILAMIPTVIYGAKWNGHFWEGLFSLALMFVMVTLGGLGISRIIDRFRRTTP
jgi:hypothetical protein